MSPTVLTVALSVAAPALKDRPDPTDIVGDWAVESYVLGGRPAPPGVTVRFGRDGRALFRNRDLRRTTEGTYVADPKTQPAEINIAFSNSDCLPMIGIYTFDGDAVVVCFHEHARPARFESPAGSGVGLLTLKRVMARH